MTAPLRLTLTLDTYPEGDRWTWTLHAGRHIVSTSGGQLFSRRIDCARGAEVGAGLDGVRALLREARGPGDYGHVYRYTAADLALVALSVRDERGRS